VTDALGREEAKPQPGSRVHKLIRDSMLTADMNYRYYACLASRYQLWDRSAKILTAIAASTTVSGLWLWDVPGWNRVWQVFCVIAAMLAVVMAVWDLTAKSKAASELSASWFAIMLDHEALWAREDSLAEDVALGACEEIRAREKPLAASEAMLWQSKRLTRRCQVDVMHQRGLESGTREDPHV